MTKTTGNTLFQSLFVAHYLLNLLSDPELESVKIATYHNLAGRDLSGSIFQNQKEDVIVHSTYEPFSMISMIFHEDVVKILQIKLENSLYVFKCYNSKDKNVITYFVNYSDCVFFLF